MAGGTRLGDGGSLKKRTRGKSAGSNRDRKKALSRVIHSRIINQFRGPVITVRFRAIARTVSSGKKRHVKKRKEVERDSSRCISAGTKQLVYRARERLRASDGGGSGRGKRKRECRLAARRDAAFFQFVANNPLSIKICVTPRPYRLIGRAGKSASALAPRAVGVLAKLRAPGAADLRTYLETIIIS